MGRISRRSFLLKSSAVAATSFFGPWQHNRVFAAGISRPIKIGLTHDLTGQYGISGASELKGSILAIEEANAAGGVLGRKIEYIHQDTQTSPAIGKQVAESLINDHEVSFISGAIHSSVADSIAKVAQKYGCVYLNTNSSSPTQSAENCHRTKFVFDANSQNFAIATVNYAYKKYGKRWLLLTNDYGWGRSSGDVITNLATSLGADILERIVIPMGTRNYVSILEKIRDIRPDVIATAVGGNDYVPLRAQAADFELQDFGWLNNQQDWPDHYTLGHNANFGTFGTTWYHGLNIPGVSDLVQAYHTRWGRAAIKDPGNVYYNGYMAMKELLGAIERVGSTDNIKIIREFEQLKIPASRRLQDFDAYMDASSHHLQQTVYMAESNDKPKSPTDLWKVLEAFKPEDVKAALEVGCVLESLEDTPSYEV